MAQTADRGDVARQLEALRRDAAASLLDDRAIVAVRGADRASFLQGMLSNEVAGLAPGEGNPALLLTEQGRVIAAVRAYALPDEVWLDVDRASREAVCAALERFVVADDVELHPLELAGVAVRGPRAAAVVAAVAADGASDLGSLAPCAHAAATIAGVGVRVTRARDLGDDAFHVWAPEDGAARAVLAVFAAAGAVEAGAQAIELERIAEGRAREGVDYDAQTLAPEVPSLASAISYRKGCYLGQEVVERVAARGHVNWIVARLAASGPAAPGVGAAVLHDGKEVGRVTSAARLPGGDEIAMLARVRRAAAEGDAGLAVDVQGAPVAAHVVATSTAGT